jgi:hypothetical protein
MKLVIGVLTALALFAFPAVMLVRESNGEITPREVWARMEGANTQHQIHADLEQEVSFNGEPVTITSSGEMLIDRDAGYSLIRTTLRDKTGPFESREIYADSRLDDVYTRRIGVGEEIWEKSAQPSDSYAMDAVSRPYDSSPSPPPDGLKLIRGYFDGHRVLQLEFVMDNAELRSSTYRFFIVDAVSFQMIAAGTSTTIHYHGDEVVTKFGWRYRGSDNPIKLPTDLPK